MLSPLIFIFKWIKYFLTRLKRTITKPGDYIIIDLSRHYTYFPEKHDNLWQKFYRPKKPDLYSLKQEIKQIAYDQRTRGVIIKISGLKLSYALLKEVAESIHVLRANNKEIYCWSKQYAAGELYLASFCDRILIQPGGGIDSLGFRVEFRFYHDLLQKLGFQLDVLKTGPYKTAADSLIRSYSSQESKEMLHWILDDLYADLFYHLAQNRKFTHEQLQSIISGLPYTDYEAISVGLVDDILNEESLPGYLKNHANQQNKEKEETGKDASPIKIENWEMAKRKILPKKPTLGPGNIGLIKIEGMIVDGSTKSSHPGIPFSHITAFMGKRSGDSIITEQIRKLEQNPRIQGVLLYIDSGGGSASASEAIAAAVETLSSKKPVIALMGEKAASGAYYIASQADYIFAYPATLTGSIGVIVGKLVTSNFFQNLLVNREIITKGKTSLFDSDSLFSQTEKTKILKTINRTYDLFLERVATGRNMEKESVDEVGRGRIWTGNQAKNIGLIDEVGGIYETLEKIKAMTGVSQVNLKEITPTGGYILPKKDPAKDEIVNEINEWKAYFDGKKPLYISELFINKDHFFL